jgi:hypothetical protein
MGRQKKVETVEKERKIEMPKPPYGRFFSDPERIKQKYNRWKVKLFDPYSQRRFYETFHSDSRLSLERYTEDIMDFSAGWDRELWKACYMWFWLRAKFIYMNHSLYSKFVSKSPLVATRMAFAKFIQTRRGFVPSIAITPEAFSTVRSYIDSLYPDFNRSYVPFRDGDLPFPFEKVGLAQMSVVRDMEEKVEIIKKAEEEDMWKYLEFLDFVIAYVKSYNDKYGKRYAIKKTASGWRVLDLSSTKVRTVRDGDYVVNSDDDSDDGDDEGLESSI